MTSDWVTIADVAKEFALDAYAGEPQRLRIELRKIVSVLHPDKNGGDFKSDADKTKYLRATEALEFLDAQEQTLGDLIPVSQLPAVISALSQALTARPAADMVSLQASAMADTRARLGRRFALPKIGSGVFAAAAAFLATISDKFEKHTLLGMLLANLTVQLFLLTLTGCSALFFIMMWYQEKRAEAQAEYLMSESALNEIFEMVSSDAHTNSPRGRVSSRQILEAVQGLAGFDRYRPPRPDSFFGPPLDLATIEKAAALQTQRLVERKLLSRIEMASLDTWYDVHGT